MNDEHAGECVTPGANVNMNPAVCIQRITPISGGYFIGRASGDYWGIIPSFTDSVL